MSGVSVSDVYEFINSFLGFTPKQRLAVLSDVTAAQCEVIRQVCVNILLNTSITISQEDRGYLNKQLPAIKKLASHNICTSDKKYILSKRGPLITRLFKIALNYISKRLDELDADISNSDTSTVDREVVVLDSQ